MRLMGVGVDHNRIVANRERRSDLKLSETYKDEANKLDADPLIVAFARRAFRDDALVVFVFTPPRRLASSSARRDRRGSLPFSRQGGSSAPQDISKLQDLQAFIKMAVWCCRTYVCCDAGCE
jgi:hypothetical protein